MTSQPSSTYCTRPYSGRACLHHRTARPRTSSLTFPRGTIFFLTVIRTSERRLYRGTRRFVPGSSTYAHTNGHQSSVVRERPRLHVAAVIRRCWAAAGGARGGRDYIIVSRVRNIFLSAGPRAMIFRSKFISTNSSFGHRLCASFSFSFSPDFRVPCERIIFRTPIDHAGRAPSTRAPAPRLRTVRRSFFPLKN